MQSALGSADVHTAGVGFRSRWTWVLVRQPKQLLACYICTRRWAVQCMSAIACSRHTGVVCFSVNSYAGKPPSCPYKVFGAGPRHFVMTCECWCPARYVYASNRSSPQSPLPQMQRLRACFSMSNSDGQEYPFLAKPKDDLRKDYRLMDFAGVLNALFNSHSGARRRGLGLQTYAVLPLTEDCGILQWVNGLVPFKAACEEVYIAAKLYKKNTTPLQVKKMYDSFQGSQGCNILHLILPAACLGTYSCPVMD